MDGIHRYLLGDADDLARAVDWALATCAAVDRTALRRAIGPHWVEAWCAGHAKAFSGVFDQTARRPQLLGSLA